MASCSEYGDGTPQLNTECIIHDSEPSDYISSDSDGMRSSENMSSSIINISGKRYA